MAIKAEHLIPEILERAEIYSASRWSKAPENF
jgi:hypothetical protein